MRISLNRDCVQAEGARDDIFDLAQLVEATHLTLAVPHNNAALCWEKGHETPKPVEEQELNLAG